MKHNLKITIILISMFIVTQFIGLAVQHADIFYIEAEINGTIQTIENPYLPEPPSINSFGESFQFFLSIIAAFVVAISLIRFFNTFLISPTIGMSTLTLLEIDDGSMSIWIILLLEE